MPLAVLRLKDDAYGRAILTDVQARLEHGVAAGAIHATLTRLEHKGLLASRVEPGTEVRAGRPRRYYRVEARGRRALNDAKAATDNVWRGFRWPLKGSV